ncbi:MAG: protein kinase [Alphaproteobacteria bacterium]|nr:protein kinase [Alphaproteobacteria bacterium]
MALGRLSPGDPVGPLRFVQELAGAGRVRELLAEHPRKGTLHRVQLVLEGPPGMDARLVDLSRRQSALKHPNLLPVSDVIDVGGIVGIVSRALDGETLRERIQRDGPMALPDALRVVEQVLAGLDAAHRAGLVHGDLQARDVRVQDMPGGVHVRVANLGVTHLTGERRGGPGAPELLDDPDGADERTDVFGVGALLFELLAGQPAFPAFDPVALRQGRHGDLAAARPDCPAGLVAVVHDCLQVDPLRRPADCVLLGELVSGAVGAGRPGVRTLQVTERPDEFHRVAAPDSSGAHVAVHTHEIVPDRTAPSSAPTRAPAPRATPQPRAADPLAHLRERARQSIDAAPPQPAARKRAGGSRVALILGGLGAAIALSIGVWMAVG